MEDPQFEIRGGNLRSDPAVYVVEIRPLAAPWLDAYVGIRQEMLDVLRPRIAVALARHPPADEIAFRSTHKVSTESGLAIYSATGPVNVGFALWVKCAQPLTDFVFGSHGRSEFRAGSGTITPVIPSNHDLDEWLARATAPRVEATPLEPLHPEAAKAFDAQAQALVRHLSTDAPPRPTRRKSFGVDLHIPNSTTVTGPMREESPVLDERGFKSLSDAEGCLSLFGPHYVELCRLAEKIQSRRPFRDVVSVTFIKEHIFDWLVRARRGDTPLQSYIEALRDTVARKLRVFELWIPLFRVFVEQDFPIGRAVCRTMPAAFFERHRDAMLQRAESADERTAITNYFERLRQDHQGHAALVVTIYAEETRAMEVAREQSEQAADLLRLYEPAVFRPDEISACILHGNQFEPKEIVFVLDDDQALHTIVKGELEDDFRYWKISRKDLAHFLILGLPQWHDVLVKPTKSDFEKLAISSLALYTGGATKHDLSDRLINTFAALESLLLKNESEPTTQNVADRLALAIERTPDKRLEAVKIIKDSYAVRSAFVHHGATTEETQLLSQFLGLAWRFYVVALPPALGHFKSREDFIGALDRMKYSG